MVGFIDATTAIGRHYEAHRQESVFNRDARFYGASEVQDMLRRAGFAVRGWAQTLAGASPETQAIDPVHPGSGFWWDAEGYPWARVREGVPRILETTAVCADCPHWEKAPEGGDEGRRCRR